MHATIKNFFYEKLGIEDANPNVLRELERAEKNFHQSLAKKNLGLKGKIFALKAKFTVKEKAKNENTVKINPFNDYLNLLLCFLSWKKFSINDIREKNQIRSKSPLLRPSDFLIIFS